MKTMQILFRSMILYMFLVSIVSASSTSVNLIDISQDNKILENGDGIYVDITISETSTIDTNITLSFNSSTATSNQDFKLKDKENSTEILINPQDQAIITIPAGELKKSLFIYTLKDCQAEGTERISIEIVNVSGGLSLGSSLDTFTDIQDSPYDSSYFYVSDEYGDDSNDGSCENPLKTLSMALYRFRDTNKNTLVIGNGTYNEINNTHVLRSGTVSNPITIRSEYDGYVSIVGNRGELERDGSEDYGLMIQGVKHIIVKGIHFVNLGVGVRVYDTVEDTTEDILIDSCTFKDNGHSGISVIRAKNVTVKNSSFIGSIPNVNSLDVNGTLCDGLCAIQDYGVAVYNSEDINVVNNYFYGRHHQALSFKEGVTNGKAEKNIFVGALYTAIFLGQNYIDNSPISHNLTANKNIVLAKTDFPVKSPIRIDNVEDANVTDNYFQDFDYSNNLSGIFVLKRVEGDINIANNILSFGQNNNNSGAFEIDDDDGCPQSSTNINIEDNIVYKVHHGLTTYNNSCSDMANDNNNTLYLLLDDPNNETVVNPGFTTDPTPTTISFDENFVSFDSLYDELTDPFELN